MEGAALRQRRELDLATFTAWHTAVFALNGFAGKLKGKLSDYLGGNREPEPEKMRNAKLIAGFQSLRARGFAVEITRH